MICRDKGKPPKYMRTTLLGCVVTASAWIEAQSAQIGTLSAEVVGGRRQGKGYGGKGECGDDGGRRRAVNDAGVLKFSA